MNDKYFGLLPAGTYQKKYEKSLNDFFDYVDDPDPNKFIKHCEKILAEKNKEE